MSTCSAKTVCRTARNVWLSFAYLFLGLLCCNVYAVISYTVGYLHVYWEYIPYGGKPINYQ